MIRPLFTNIMEPWNSNGDYLLIGNKLHTEPKWNIFGILVSRLFSPSLVSSRSHMSNKNKEIRNINYKKKEIY